MLASDASNLMLRFVEVIQLIFLALFECQSFEMYSLYTFSLINGFKIRSFTST